MIWTLIFAATHGDSPQTFEVDTDDPEAAAQQAVDDNEWLRPGHTLIAAVQVRPVIRVRDDAQGPCNLQE